jgi:uncharacterized protein DUF6599
VTHRPTGFTATVILLISFLALPALAGTRYPRVVRDSQGTWIATDEALIQVVGELFTFYGSADGLPSDRVRMVAPDDREVWAATPRGLGRMDRSSRRWEAFVAPEPLPSNNVFGVAVDDRYVWVGTAAGAARYDKNSRDWTKLTGAQGPGAQPVYEVLSLGQNVWFATANGAYRFDRQTQVWRHFGPSEGFVLGEIYEIIQAGESLWFLCKKGLARFDLRTEAVSTFTEKDGLPSPQITAFSSVEGDIWIGTEKGLAIYSEGADAISPFIYTKGLPGGVVTGIEVAVPWVWVSTDQGLGMFNTMRKVWEEKRAEDGLADPDIEGITLAGSMLVILQPVTFQGYSIQQDDWISFAIDDIWSGQAGSKTEPSTWRFNLELTMSGEGNFARTTTHPVDAFGNRLPDQEEPFCWESGGGSCKDQMQLIPDLRLGVGTELEGGRALDASIRLDAGDVMTGGIREYDGELRLHGNETDPIKELLISDEMPMIGQENDHDLLQDAWLEGLGVYQRMGDNKGRKKDPVTVEVEAGLRRGIRNREFFRGTLELTFQLEKQYITPASDVVKVDGMILERGVDYIITHTTGQLTFLNPDRVNALSLIEITYTYEQIPRKATTGRSLLEMLPWDNEIGTFSRSGTPTYVTGEGGLYKKINGAAPVYIERGWVESVFMDYIQGSTTVKVQINDMGTPEQARDIFDFNRPVSYEPVWEEDEDSLALRDINLPSGYTIKMWMGRFFVELSIDGKSPLTESLIDLFAQAIRTKGNLSGTLYDSLRPLVGRLHVGVNPTDHFGIGVGYLGSQDIKDSEVMNRMNLTADRYDLGTIDLWTDHQLGSGAYGGRLYSYFQGGKGHSRVGQDHHEGYAASGNILYNAQALNLRVDGEVHSGDFETLGTRSTVLGKFASDIRGDATFMPLRWLSLRLLYDHQRSYLAPDLALGSSGQGINENLLGKLAFMKARWPTVWFLAGRSVLSGAGHQDEKLRLAGSLEYDLAKGVLDFLGFRKFAIKAYFDHSENEVSGPVISEDGRWSSLGSAPGTAQNMRFELKLAPTKTEDAYARFERKTFDPSESSGPIGQQPLEAWELIMGAASRYIEGLVPTFNGKISHYKGDKDVGDTTETVETAAALLSGQIEMFPGRWIDALGSLMLAVGYGYTNSEEASNRAMDLHLQKHQVEGRASYGNYDDPFRIETRGKWWTIHEDEFQYETEHYYEVLNRLTFRPVYTSPITLRFDFSELKQTPLDSRVTGTTQRYGPSLEWEKRWSQDLVTKIRIETPLSMLDMVHDENLSIDVSYRQWGLKPWAEVRLRIRDFLWGSLLRLTVRGSFTWIDWFKDDWDKPGAENAWEASSSLYLDWEKSGSFTVRLGVVYTRHKCIERVRVACASYDAIQPSIKAIARF